MAVSFDAILVPTDGSESVDRATRHALALAERYGATVHALYVLDDRYLTADVEGISAASTVESALVEEGEAVVGDVADHARERGLDVETAVRRGVPSRTIVDYAGEAGVDLVAMGTHGRTGLGRLLLGSVAERVVRSAPVPVLTARASEAADGDAGDERATDDRAAAAATDDQAAAAATDDQAADDTEYDEILVPTDGSDTAARAAEYAVDLAERYGATVHALSVVDTRLSQAAPLRESFRGVASDAVEEIEELAARRDLSATTEIREGPPSVVVVDYAREIEADLVAMGTHGRTGLDRVALGSVAERVVRSTPAPVLTVRDADGA